MTTKLLNRIAALLAVTGMIMLAIPQAYAAESGPKHKVVIQVSTSDPESQRIALNNTVNLQKYYGIDNVAIEIVAYGPGLSLLTDKSEQGERVRSLLAQDVQFSACGVTMKSITKKTGKAPILLPGVKVVDAGVPRIMELQEQGWSYIRP